MPKRLDSKTVQRYLALRRMGLRQSQAREEVGISRQSAHKLDHQLPPGVDTTAELRQRTSNPPRSFDQLSDTGKECLRSFPAFSKNFFVRDVPPWRVAAAEIIVEAVCDRDEQSFIVLNAPVGAGKSSLLRDVVTWAIAGGGSCDPAFGRSLRVLYGHAVASKAEQSVDLIRQTLSSPVPYYDHTKKLSAPTSLLREYGRFRPQPSDDDADMPWRQAKFTVASLEDQPVFNKEPTVQAISYGMTFVGERGDLIVLDDVVSPKNVGDPDFLKWIGAVEDRLEPGGTVVWLGQRIAIEDGYAEVLGRTWDPDEVGAEVPLYVRVSWPAHNEATCDGNHRQWDLGQDGCLLDERRIPMRKIRAEQDKPSFAASYQQDPSLGGDGLVSRLHLEGGKDAGGQEFPGCLDLNRQLGEYPPGVDNLITFASCDPALSSGYWGVEVFATPPALNGVRYLVDAIRKPMRPDEWLGIGSESGQLRGLMVDMQIASKQAGRPIQVWILESNLVGSQIASSNAFVFFEKSFPDVTVLWHRTHRNKAAPQVGIEALVPPLVRSGRLRIPWLGVEARNVMRQLQLELLGYPNAKTSDLVMALWFGEANIAEILHRAERPQGEVPFVDLGTMPDYLRRQREASMRPDAKPRPLPAPLGSYAAGLALNGPAAFTRFTRTPSIEREGQ